MANSKLRMFSFFHANPGPTPSLRVTGPRRVRTRDRTSPGGELMTPSRDDSERLHLWPFTTCRATASRWTRPAGRPRRNSSQYLNWPPPPRTGPPVAARLRAPSQSLALSCPRSRRSRQQSRSAQLGDPLGQRRGLHMPGAALPVCPAPGPSPTDSGLRGRGGSQPTRLMCRPGRRVLLVRVSVSRTRTGTLAGRRHRDHGAQWPSGSLAPGWADRDCCRDRRDRGQLRARL